MDKETRHSTSERSSRRISGSTLLIGVAGGIAALAWLSMRNTGYHMRRYSDRFEERRDPMQFFLAGKYPRRRKIDVSGRHPLFERRQSVYDAY